jgi:hypothetical protein
MVEAGELGWAFDISITGKGKREVRVLASCVFEFLDYTQPQEDWETVSNSIIPKTRVAVPTSELAQAWSCVPDHCLHLVRAERLRLARGTAYRPGRNGSALIDRASAMGFLLDRRIF